MTLNSRMAKLGRLASLKPTSKTVGDSAEQAALDYLNRKGLTLVAQNYRCRRGEIDLIMQDNDCLVFVEVRLRKNPNFVSAVESVDSRKQRKLRLCVEHFLSSNPKLRNQAMRFDIMASDGKKSSQGDLQFDWYQNAFEC